MPKVSVIVITYNTGNLIVRAIQSAIEQTYKDFEIIIVDDGSTDNTKELVERFGDKVRYLYQKNQGISVARNTGILASKGDYIAFLDSDDWWMKDKLEVQAGILDSHPRVGLVYASVPIINENGEDRGVWPHKPSANDFLGIIEKGAFYQPSTVMVRRECFAKAGLFDELMNVIEDMEMWLRIVKYYDVYEIKGRFISFYYRQDDKPPRHKVRLFSNQVRLYRKILVLYDDIPQVLVKRRLARFQYLLGRAYMDVSDYTMAMKNIAAAILKYPMVEKALFYGSENLPKKMLKIVRPYIILGKCAIMSLLPKAKKRVAA